jgi:hypothetical protein
MLLFGKNPELTRCDDDSVDRQSNNAALLQLKLGKK